jgi:hypothetical protein
MGKKRDGFEARLSSTASLGQTRTREALCRSTQRSAHFEDLRVVESLVGMQSSQVGRLSATTSFASLRAYLFCLVFSTSKPRDRFAAPLDGVSVMIVGVICHQNHVTCMRADRNLLLMCCATRDVFAVFRWPVPRPLPLCKTFCSSFLFPWRWD